MLSQYSDVAKVKALGKKYGVDVLPSDRKDKKYMIIRDGKKIHFGAMGYQDWTKHGDAERRDAFRKRNVKWKDAPKYSPSWLSYWILW